MKLRALLICAFALVACDDDDDDLVPDDDDDVTAAARDFQVRIENVAPWTVLRTGTQTQKLAGGEGIIGAGEAFEIRFTAGKGQNINFAMMLVESNDWFFAPGPEGIPLFSTDGTPTSGDVTRFVRLWDAGTEFDQEPGAGDAIGLRQPSRDFGEADPQIDVREVDTTVRLDDGRTFVRPETTSMIRVTLTPGPDQQFTLRIQNRSNTTTLSTSIGTMPIRLSTFTWAVHTTPAPIFTPDEPERDNGLEQLAEAGLPDPLGQSLRNVRGAATGLSPGVFVVHTNPDPLFLPGAADFGVGLEQLAEDGNQVPLADALAAAPPPGVVETGSFDTPVGASAPGPAMPGQAFELTVHGEPGQFLSFASMFYMSNDWFFATRPEGIALFFGDVPRWGDVTSDTVLYDLGTESDEELDVGPNTAAQQPAPNTGRPDRTAVVREVTLERYPTPEVLHIRVTVTPL
jgi:hypothetical protein